MRPEFGQYLRELRIASGVTLRQFAFDVGLDPSNYSRIERGEAPPPSESTLALMAARLGVPPAQDERWFQLLAHADVARGRVPGVVLDNDEIARHLPALFARVHQRQPASLAELYDTIRQVIEGFPNNTRGGSPEVAAPESASEGKITSGRSGSGDGDQAAPTRRS